MSRIQTDNEAAALPAHVAVIMDGNGRWARQQGKPRRAGHRAGVKAARRLVEDCGRRGIRYLTLFAFSSENWRRPRQEVGALMTLMVEALEREVSELSARGVQLRFIGDRAALPPVVRTRMDDAEARTRANEGLTLVVALSYGGRWDIVQAAQRLAREAARGDLDPESIDEAQIGSRLSLGQLPDPDLLIRTGGEYRISNFLLWNLAYAECYFTDCLWPAFDEQELTRALEFYAQRERRFGLTPEQVETA
jgi:undecaprenyl diphosphate synthase